MANGDLRDLDQIQESEHRHESRLGGLIMASLVGALAVFAVVAMIRKPVRIKHQQISPLDELAAKAPAASAQKKELSPLDVTFPTILSDSNRPTTALAAIGQSSAASSSQAATQASSWPMLKAPNGATSPPPPTDKLPVIPMPAQGMLGASPVITQPKDPMTAAAHNASTTKGELAEEGRAGPYVLQVSSFKHAHEASSFAMALRQRGHRAYVEQGIVPNRGVWHRVRIGPFKSAREANQYRNEFEKREHIVPFLIDNEKERKIAEERENHRRAKEARRHQ